MYFWDPGLRLPDVTLPHDVTVDRVLPSATAPEEATSECEAEGAPASPRCRCCPSAAVGETVHREALLMMVVLNRW